MFIYHLAGLQRKNDDKVTTDHEKKNGQSWDEMTHCCAECGEEGGIALRTCKLCMLVKYCNAKCQKNHWPKHKIGCRRRAAELRDEALFKDPPNKEDCYICFLLPPATISSIPIYDFAVANEELQCLGTEQYFTCCGKSICGGCIHSFGKTGNNLTCPFCNSERDKTEEEHVEDLMKRAEANDPLR